MGVTKLNVFLKMFQVRCIGDIITMCILLNYANTTLL